MAKTFLEYFKLILPQFTFDQKLLVKEYQKALKLLNRQEQIHLSHWMQRKGMNLMPVKVKK